MNERDPDRDCLSRVRDGDRAALTELYDRHTAMLYALALRIVRRASDAEDVVQETWLQAWRTAASWDSSRGSVAGWLVTITRSRAIDRFRSLASRRNAEGAADVPAPAASPAPAESAVATDRRRRVTEALQSLPETQRQSLELAYFGGLSQTEIAAKLGAPLGTVKSWCRQGLLRLRELVPQEEWS